MNSRHTTPPAGRTFMVVLLISCATVSCEVKRGPGDVPRPVAANSATVQMPTVLVTAVKQEHFTRNLRLPGDLTAYQDVPVYPKVQGFVETIGVDRGSVVQRGQHLVRMIAPELSAQKNEAQAKARAVEAQRFEAEAKLQSIRAQKLEAESKLASDEATNNRLKAASATPGVVAGNDLEVSQKTVEGERARIRAWEENEKAAQAQLRSLEESEKASAEAARSIQDIESYLRITAPFDGVITERNVHEGSLVGPSSGTASPPMLRIQQISRLRLTVAVPESDVAGISTGTKVNFALTAFPGETFSGGVSRVAHALDLKTRTMPVELDVDNTSGRIAPGMYAEVSWPSRRPRPSLFVPRLAVATTTERTFVIRIRDGGAEWVDVKRGGVMGETVEIFGNLQPGDMVAVRGTDELRAGTRVSIRQAP